MPGDVVDCLREIGPLSFRPGDSDLHVRWKEAGSPASVPEEAGWSTGEVMAIIEPGGGGYASLFAAAKHLSHLMMAANEGVSCDDAMAAYGVRTANADGSWGEGSGFSRKCCAF